jgi:hypothetical protein
VASHVRTIEINSSRREDSKPKLLVRRTLLAGRNIAQAARLTQRRSNERDSKRMLANANIYVVTERRRMPAILSTSVSAETETSAVGLVAVANVKLMSAGLLGKKLQPLVERHWPNVEQNERKKYDCRWSRKY